MDAKKVIIDIATKLGNETTEAKKAELAGRAAPKGRAGFKNCHARIDGLKMSDGACRRFCGVSAAQLRKLLHGIVDVTVKVGGKAVRVGRRIVRWLLSLLNHYPSTLSAAVIMGALVFLIAQIPLLGSVLMPVAMAIAEVAVLAVAVLESVRTFVKWLAVSY